MTTPDPMAEIRASFFVECEELLEAMHDGLQALDDGDRDAETINIVFRAVHSIKGGAGAFGLDAMVRFAHRFETVLDLLRGGTLAPEPDLIKLFFRAGDHLSDLVRVCRDDDPIPEAESDAVLAQLAAYDSTADLEEEEEEIDFQPLGLSLDLGLDLPPLDAAPATPTYRITFAPHAEMYENGNEVAPILRALCDMGEADVTCDTSQVPSLSGLDPAKAYLSWTIVLTTDVAEAEIRSTFDFVDGLCHYAIEVDAADAPDLPPLVDMEIPEPLPEPLPEQLPETPEPAPQAAQEPEPDSSKPQESQAKSGRGAPAGAVKSVVRVDLDRIERLVNLVGELVINQAMLAQSLETAGLSPHSEAMHGLEEFQRLTRDIQDSVMMIRAQPVKSLFQRMSRIVREASGAVGKDVRLVTEGENTEVDKTVIERLADPLTHMIRNCVDHGLEKSDDRIAAGKPPQGVVRLSAAHRSGRVVIEVSDDGAGINRPRVLQIAIEKGLIPAESNLSDTEIDNLLFLPGFSTAGTVSDLSGRGVGMDVVRTSIQALGGRITIQSTPGEGTTISISLPLTLAVLDGMVIGVADETLVVPLNMVAETITLSAENLDQIQPGVDAVRVRGGFVPLHDLGCVLGYRARQESYVDAVALLIQQEDGNRSALVVDEIEDQRQVVIKGLDEAFYSAPGIAAATILGDGQIALILDPSDIVAQAASALPSTMTNPRMEA
ncbi:MAG: chemotaxis protein CheA [Pseudomonadota bacterium]